MSAAGMVKWMLWAIGLALCGFGVFRPFQSIGFMLDRKPTGASLTLAMGVVSVVIGLAIFGTGFLFRGKKKSAEKFSGPASPRLRGQIKLRR